MQMPWWTEGVPFQCKTDCGKCCDEPGGIVYLQRSDAERLAAHHGMEVEAWLERDCRRTIDGRFILNSDPISDICIYLDDKKQCTVYQSRPSQCSAFPFWSENLRSNRSWKKTVDFCPGLQDEDAIIVNGNEIRIKVVEDQLAMKGFRQW